MPDRPLSDWQRDPTPYRYTPPGTAIDITGGASADGPPPAPPPGTARGDLAPQQSYAEQVAAAEAYEIGQRAVQGSAIPILLMENIRAATTNPLYPGTKQTSGLVSAPSGIYASTGGSADAMQTGTLPPGTPLPSPPPGPRGMTSGAGGVRSTAPATATGETSKAKVIGIGLAGVAALGLGYWYFKQRG
jgi:hypothetical protein